MDVSNILLFCVVLALKNKKKQNKIKNNNNKTNPYQHR